MRDRKGNTLIFGPESTQYNHAKAGATKTIKYLQPKEYRRAQYLDAMEPETGVLPKYTIHTKKIPEGKTMSDDEFKEKVASGRLILIDKTGEASEIHRIEGITFDEEGYKSPIDYTHVEKDVFHPTETMYIRSEKSIQDGKEIPTLESEWKEEIRDDYSYTDIGEKNISLENARRAKDLQRRSIERYMKKQKDDENENK